MIEIVLFDLGGVLVELRGLGQMVDLTGLPDEDAVRERWLACRWVRAFERGECTPEAFAAGVVGDWELDLTPAAFLERFEHWIEPLPPEAEALVREVRAVVPVGCLSNTNRHHWDLHFGTSPVFRELDHRFVSFELGAVKPDRELFDHVAAALPAPAGNVLFLEDSQPNIDGALAAGFDAVLVRGIDDARRVLVERGVLTPPSAS